MAFSLGLDNVIEVRANATLAGQRLITTMHYAITDGVEADYDTLITSLHTNLTDPINGWLSGYKDAVSDDWSGLWVDYQRILPLRLPYVRKTWAVSGSIVSPSIPPGATGAITKRGTITGKGRTGHVLYSGVPSDMVSFGQLTNAYMTGEAGSFATTLAAVHTVETMQLRPIISVAKIGGAWNFMTAGQVEKDVRTMSRRVVGRGI